MERNPRARLKEQITRQFGRIKYAEKKDNIMNSFIKILAITRSKRDAQAAIVAQLEQANDKALAQAVKAIEETDNYKDFQQEKKILMGWNETVSKDEETLKGAAIREWDAGNFDTKKQDFGTIKVKKIFEIVNEKKIIAWIRERKLQNTFLKVTVKIPVKHKSTLWGMFKADFEDEENDQEPTQEALEYSENPWITFEENTVFEPAKDLTAFLDDSGV